MQTYEKGTQLVYIGPDRQDCFKRGSVVTVFQVCSSAGWSWIRPNALAGFDIVPNEQLVSLRQYRLIKRWERELQKIQNELDCFVPFPRQRKREVNKRYFALLLQLEKEEGKC